MTLCRVSGKLTVRMTRHSSFPFYDHVFGGRLADQLAEWRAAGVSTEEIAFRVRERSAKRNLPSVSQSTVRRWLAELETKAS